ncbi:MAG: ribosome recycling factor, partial [Bacteroidales bacterium]|nr:ribosome recycling factor [Bacteroidales bacterium]
KELVKKARMAGENAKVGVRNARRDAIDALKKLQKEGLPEDTEKDFEDEVQKLTDNFSKKVEDILSAKEKEIMTV